MAKNTIVQRISLDGGEAIKSQLQALGSAGERAFKQMAAVDRANFEKFSASLGKARTDLAAFVKNTALLGTGLAAAAGGAGAAVFSLAKSSAESADEAGKNAQKTGLQIDAYGRLEFAAKQANVSQDQFVSSMSKLNKSIAEAAAQTSKAGGTFDASGVTVTRFGAATEKAAEKTETAGTAFDRLGIKLKDANGKLRPTEAIIGDLAEAFSRLEDGPVKVALGMEIFGKSFADLIPFLNQGRDGIRDLGKEADKLGLTLTAADTALGDNLGDTLDELAGAIFGIKRKLGLLFAPIVLAGAEGFRDIIVQNKDAILQFGAEAARVTAGVLGAICCTF
ncbi:phage tail tape measure protein [Mesorhizobium sp. CO1-1-7]|uniref:phage tail tape measure protein n=1 Tax=Mesorhizobium sp. CO1-1-7 TaxID=2876632 RepID=UPI001CD10874|nr:phage tail tape measure protein [Mesorhizobium sp. CO1-1-7]MBZ9748298.1 phage tail tape measure protein [Mesorhizobium sp. CO1-1-7]